MNLENYVCTLEQAKKLDKLLGKRESIFYYGESEDDSPRIYQSGHFAPGKFIANAYTSQELGEEIKKLSDYWRQYTASPGKYLFLNERGFFDYSSNSEAHARAEFLIYFLKKNK